MQIRSKYDSELKDVAENLLSMFMHTETAVELCIALMKKDDNVAKEVKKEERRIDKLELKIEKACLRLLVMQQPVASDFRIIYSTLKMVTDLERIGDQARDIAKLLAKNTCEYPKHLPEMLETVHQMFIETKTAHANRDIMLARSIDEKDDKVDSLFQEIITDIAAMVKENPDSAEHMATFILVAKYLERIGDHAVNLGEWVQYENTGKNPRRKKGKTSKPAIDENIHEYVSGQI